MATQNKNLDDVFSSIVENMQLVVDQLKDGQSRETGAADFTLQDFWTQIEKVVKGISAHATKLCMAFSKPPAPSAKECEPLIDGLEKISLALVSSYYMLPKDRGKYLLKSTQKSVVLIMTSVQALCETIRKEGCHGSQRQLQSTGGVWEYCDRFTKLPKDNKEAVLKLGKEGTALVNDALEELEEAKKSCEEEINEEKLSDDEEDEEEEERWSQDDLTLLAPAIGLIKASKAAMKKVVSALRTNGSCGDKGSVCQLDEIGSRLDRVSPAVDDMSTVLYPPMPREEVRTYATDLAAVLRDLLEVAKHTHITGEDDASWVEFLTKAIDHNMDKIQTLTTPS